MALGSRALCKPPQSGGSQRRGGAAPIRLVTSLGGMSEEVDRGWECYFGRGSSAWKCKDRKGKFFSEHCFPLYKYPIIDISILLLVDSFVVVANGTVVMTLVHKWERFCGHIYTGVEWQGYSVAYRQPDLLPTWSFTVSLTSALEFFFIPILINTCFQAL